MFGLGMTLTGTCGFGLLVRAGAGDLRAAIAAIVVGIMAMTATAGLLAPLRQSTLAFGAVDFSIVGGSSILQMLSRHVGPTAATAAISPPPSCSYSTCCGTAGCGSGPGC